MTEKRAPRVVAAIIEDEHGDAILTDGRTTARITKIEVEREPEVKVRGHVRRKKVTR